MSSKTPSQDNSSGEGIQKQLRCVEQFYRVFGRDAIRTTPAANIGLERARMRHKLMQEENQEYLDAAESGDIVEIADALGDQLYVLCGSIIAHGMQDIIEDVFTEIHRSNMSKLGPDGKPVYREGDGKILKGPNYTRPDLKDIVESRMVIEKKN
ncbi:hypothetical protein K4F52_009561 [Lecanicillium sp. MT-2017a]|nr:hypothetical protein K4F52_009561 [Lecanicillium sp. MT-2017a]